MDQPPDVHGSNRREPTFAPGPGVAPTGARFDDLLQRARSEYLEMPGLRLTLEQAQRLWHLGRGECEAVLNGLIGTGFLARTPIGAFVRAGSGSSGA